MPQSPRANAARRPPPSPVSPSKTLQQDAFGGPSSPKRTAKASSQANQRKGSQLGTTSDYKTGHTFLEDSTPTETHRSNNDDGEDPHDLAFSPQHVPRASMVDNMVKSLDQFANPTMPSFEDSGDFPTHSSGMGAARRRGHTFSSSVSSDGDGRDQRPWPHHTAYNSRVVRRNSAAKFSRQKLPSIFGEDEESTRVKVYDAQRATRAPKLRSKSYYTNRGATGSASSSVDLSHLSNLRLGAAGDRRSRSFDFGSRRSGDLLRSAPDPIDVAPTPVIYAGLEAQNSPIKGSFGGFPVRRNSNKSSKSVQVKKSKPTAANGDTFRAANHDPMSAMPTMRSSPALNSVLTDNINAPSPSLDIAAMPRPGFFRRMFSSSKNQSAPELSPQLAPETTSRGRSTPVAEQAILATANHQQGRNNIHRPSTDVGPGKENHPTFAKKSSSFFRRRKKSVSSGPPPPLPLNLAANTALNGQSSPVSSLRALMDPYLANTQQGSRISGRLSDEQAGYHTSQSTPRAADDQAINLSDRKFRDAMQGLQRATRPALQIPSSKSTSGLRVPHQDSFFADNSSTEGRSRSSTGLSPVSDSPLSEFIDRSPAESLHQTPSNNSSAANAAFSRPSGSSQPGSRQKEKKIGLPAHLSATATKTTANSQLRLDMTNSEPGTKAAGFGVISTAPTESPRASMSDVSEYRSAPSTPMVPEEPLKDTFRSPVVHISHPSVSKAMDDDLNKARRLFNNDDPEVAPADASAWLGENDPQREHVRKAYMELFDWTGLNILAAMRGLCDRIALKGETQQVDRMLDAFAQRWCDCNSNHGFKSDDVVHTICYSLLLLNTDLHLADIGQKMTRVQFVRNTLPTIKRVASSVHARVDDRAQSPAVQPGSTPSAVTSQRLSVDYDGASTPVFGRPSERLVREDSGDLEVAAIASGPLVDAPYLGSERGWEQQIETVLKSFYNSVSRQRLPLYGAVDDSNPTNATGGLLSMTSNMLRRTPSTLSKAQSDTGRGRLGSESRSLGARFTAKARSRPRLTTSLGFSSSRTSLDEQSSAWSPSMSSTWSKASLGKTLTSISVDSFESEAVKPDYMSSIGFANALSQAIIREDQLSAALDEGLKMGPLLDDESLELSGAPWAKEGMLKHKCHLDGVDKRSKDRQWNDCFAVIDKGWMRLFSFSMNARTIKQKAKHQKAGGVVGGGNWQDNAEELRRFMLRHTIASSLPPPGYSKTRPYVWALSLPTGAVHLFSVGTPDIVKEFVSTANYWSARLSKEPMMGGISNMEYGWSDAVINRALVGSESQPGLTRVPASPRPSTQMSMRSSIDHGTGMVRPKLPGDKVYINDWQPPQQSMMASQLMEVDQLRALQAYVKNVEEELSKHNELRGAMLLAFSAKHPNSGRAMSNWEKKSSYLLREIVKFSTYIDTLQNAQSLRERVYAMRREDDENRRQADDARALAAGMNSG